MIQIQSKLTSQGQVSVPAAVRRQLGLAPGASIEWVEDNGRIVVRRAAAVESETIHAALFPEGKPRRQSLRTLRQGIAEAMRQRRAAPDARD